MKTDLSDYIEDALNTIKTWQGAMEKTCSSNDFAKEYLGAVDFLVRFVIESGVV